MDVSVTISTEGSIEDEEGKILVPSAYIELKDLPTSIRGKEEIEEWLKRNLSALLATVLVGDMTFNNITEYLWKLNNSYRVKVRMAQDAMRKAIEELEDELGEYEDECD
jgi:hypothetical protein